MKLTVRVSAIRAGRLRCGLPGRGYAYGKRILVDLDLLDGRGREVQVVDLVPFTTSVAPFVPIALESRNLDMVASILVKRQVVDPF
jgi:hypothetical protein